MGAAALNLAAGAPAREHTHAVCHEHGGIRGLERWRATAARAGFACSVCAVVFNAECRPQSGSRIPRLHNALISNGAAA
jgi:hypothetical protein